MLPKSSHLRLSLTATSTSRSFRTTLASTPRIGGNSDLSREALSDSRKAKAPDEEAFAQAVLARVLLVQGRTAEAQDSIGHVRERARVTQNVPLRLAVAITSARVLVASGKPAHLAEACAAVAQGPLEPARVISLREAFAAGGVDIDSPVITSCGSGVAAATAWLALDALGRVDIGIGHRVHGRGVGAL